MANSETKDSLQTHEVNNSNSERHKNDNNLDTTLVNGRRFFTDASAAFEWKYCRRDEPPHDFNSFFASIWHDFPHQTQPDLYFTASDEERMSRHILSYSSESDDEDEERALYLGLLEEVKKAAEPQKQCKLQNSIPGFSMFEFPNKKSILCQEQMAECFQIVQLLSTFKTPTEKQCETMRVYKARIDAEQQIFMELAQTYWRRSFHARHKEILSQVEAFVNSLWQDKLIEVRQEPKFYSKLSSIPLCPQSEESVEMLFVSNLYSMGKGPPCFMPLLNKYKITLNSFADDISQEYKKDKQKCVGQHREQTAEKYHPKVSEDKICEDLALEHGANIVMSAAAFTTLIDNHSPFIHRWHIPIIVKEYTVGQKKKKVIYFDKPLGTQSMSHYERKQKYFKIAANRSFSQLRVGVHRFNKSNKQQEAKPSEALPQDNIQNKAKASTKPLDSNISRHSTSDISHNNSGRSSLKTPLNKNLDEDIAGALQEGYCLNDDSDNESSFISENEMVIADLSLSNDDSNKSRVHLNKKQMSPLCLKDQMNEFHSNPVEHHKLGMSFSGDKVSSKSFLEQNITAYSSMNSLDETELMDTTNSDNVETNNCTSKYRKSGTNITSLSDQPYNKRSPVLSVEKESMLHNTQSMNMIASCTKEAKRDSKTLGNKLCSIGVCSRPENSRSYFGSLVKDSVGDDSMDNQLLKNTRAFMRNFSPDYLESNDNDDPAFIDQEGEHTIKDLESNTMEIKTNDIDCDTVLFSDDVEDIGMSSAAEDNEVSQVIEVMDNFHYLASSVLKKKLHLTPHNVRKEFPSLDSLSQQTSSKFFTNRPCGNQINLKDEYEEKSSIEQNLSNSEINDFDNATVKTDLDSDFMKTENSMEYILDYQQGNAASRSIYDSQSENYVKVLRADAVIKQEASTPQNSEIKLETVTPLSENGSSVSENNILKTEQITPVSGYSERNSSFAGSVKKENYSPDTNMEYSGMELSKYPVISQTLKDFRRIVGIEKLDPELITPHQLVVDVKEKLNIKGFDPSHNYHHLNLIPGDIKMIVPERESKENVPVIPRGINKQTLMSRSCAPKASHLLEKENLREIVSQWTSPENSQQSQNLMKTNLEISSQHNSNPTSPPILFSPESPPMIDKGVLSSGDLVLEKKASQIINLAERSKNVKQISPMSPLFGEYNPLSREKLDKTPQKIRKVQFSPESPPYSPNFVSELSNSKLQHKNVSKVHKKTEPKPTLHKFTHGKATVQSSESPPVENNVSINRENMSSKLPGIKKLNNAKLNKFKKSKCFQNMSELPQWDNLSESTTAKDTDDFETLLSAYTKKRSNLEWLNNTTHDLSNQQVSYNMWKLHKSEPNIMSKNFSNDINVLIRCKEGHRKKNGMLVKLSVKTEYQNELGAEQVTLSEVTREWASVMIRPQTNVLRVRINAVDSEIVQIQELSAPLLAREALRLHKVKLADRLSSIQGVLERVLNENLTPGRYLLSHTEPAFAAIHVPTDTASFSLSLHNMYPWDPCTIGPDRHGWVPLDTQTLTPRLIKCSRLPAMFKPPKKLSSPLQRSALRSLGLGEDGEVYRPPKKLRKKSRKTLPDGKTKKRQRLMKKEQTNSPSSKKSVNL